MNHIIFLVLVGSGGGKVIRHVEYDIPALPEVLSGPVGDYSGFSSLPSSMSALSALSGLSGAGYHYGPSIGLSEPEDGDFWSPLVYGRPGEVQTNNFNGDFIGGGRGGGHVGIATGSYPSGYRLTYHNGQYSRSQVYNYPPQYVGYPYGYGHTEFFVTGKRREASDEKIRFKVFCVKHCLDHDLA